MKKCNSCQAELSEDVQFCGVCGAKQIEIEQKRFCQKCGVQMNGDALYCGSCGHSQDSVVKKPIPMMVWYALATVAVTIGMIVLVANTFGNDDSHIPSPVASKEQNISIKGTNLAPEKNSTKEVNKTIAQIVPNETVKIKSNLLTRENIKSFMQNYLQANCFGSVGDVDMFFSQKIDRYFNFKNPTHTSIYNENLTYCNRWNTMEYQLDSFEIKNNNTNSNEINIVANISYHVTSDSKDIYSKSTMPITLVDEFGLIKIKSIHSTNVKDSETKPKNQTKKYINPNNDEWASSAYELITGERRMDSSKITITKNSKGIKIYCVQSVCKTENEVEEYLNY